MKLVAGLGNPGPEYAWTRHNTGFIVLDFYFKLHHLTWDKHPRSGAITGKAGDVLFVKPQRFYNLSGEPVQALTHYFNIPPADILVVCDDFALEFGKIRLRSKGSAGGNNGLKSVIAQLGTEEFPRLRLGTGNTELRQRLGDVDFVLSKFTSAEKADLPAIFAAACQKIDDFCAQ